MKKDFTTLFKEWINSCKELAGSKEFWKDVAIFAAVAVLLYAVYIIVEYWPEIVQGFNKGWNSR